MGWCRCGEFETKTPGQKTYAITVDGVAELGAWWQAVPVDDPPHRDELMLKVLMAIRDGREHALRVITRQRTVLMSMLRAKRRERRAGMPPGTADGSSLAVRLVTDAIVARAEADLRWLDTCEAQLQIRTTKTTTNTNTRREQG